MSLTSSLTVARELIEHKKNVLDALSLVTVLGTLAAWLPSIAALVSIVWGLIRIYETKTMQSLVKWIAAKRQGRKVRRARRKAAEVVAPSEEG